MFVKWKMACLYFSRCQLGDVYFKVNKCDRICGVIYKKKTVCDTNSEIKSLSNPARYPTPVSKFWPIRTSIPGSEIWLIWTLTQVPEILLFDFCFNINKLHISDAFILINSKIRKFTRPESARLLKVRFQKSCWFWSQLDIQCKNNLNTLIRNKNPSLVSTKIQFWCKPSEIRKAVYI